MMIKIPRKIWIVFFSSFLVFLIILMSIWSDSDLIAPRASYYLVDRNTDFLAQVGQEKKYGYGYWPLTKLPPRVAAATLALEDHRFYLHPGVDPIAILRAVKQNFFAGKRVSGASTIAMQVVRMQHSRKRTIINKAIEAFAALLLTLRHDRELILKHYLRLVPYANQSHGIAHAARFYLNKPVEDLSWAEISFLAAIPQAPSLANPFHESGRKRARERGQRILTYLFLKQVLTAEEYELGQIQLEKIQINPDYKRKTALLHPIIKLEKMLTQLPAENQKYNLVTTIDIKLQESMAKTGLNFLKSIKKDKVNNLAAVIIKRKNMEVLVWLGSGDYFNTEAGSIDFASKSRSPGSLLKPFIYAKALEDKKISGATILDDLYTSRGMGNADHQFLGPMLPRQALGNSRNVPAINLLKKTGMEKTYDFFRQLGIHNSNHEASYWGLGLAIGSLPSSLEQIIQAYSIFTNDGKYQKLQWYKGSPNNQKYRFLSKGVSRHISLMLSDPEARLPSFQRMGPLEYPFSVAVKTGTSQGYRDGWTIAWSKDYLVGAWIGRHDATPMKKAGGSVCAALVQKILIELHKDWQSGMADLSFPRPIDYRNEEICSYTGKLATSGCDRKLLEWFPAEFKLESAPELVSIIIDKKTGRPATDKTPEIRKKQKIFLNIPMRYKSWAKTNNMPEPLPAEFSLLQQNSINIQTQVPVIDTRNFTRGMAFLDKEPIKLTITSPRDGLKLIQDHTIPDSSNTIALRVEISESVEQVLWYVDGTPFKLATAPYSVRWPLKRGRHNFEARLPYRKEKTKIVSVEVQ
jgi:penicillin-binding protein 1C